MSLIYFIFRSEMIIQFFCFQPKKYYFAYTVYIFVSDVTTHQHVRFWKFGLIDKIDSCDQEKNVCVLAQRKPVNEFIVHYKVIEKHYKRVKKLQNFTDLRFSYIKNIKTGVPRVVDMPW